MVRCVNCGSSRLDAECVGCVLCGGSPAVRREQCHVSPEAQVEILMNAKQLERFGVKVELHEYFTKLVGGPKGFGVAIDVADCLERNVLQQIVSFLNGKIRIQDILRLRLDEPETILTCSLEA